jgi:phage tail sheath protein FI
MPITPTYPGVYIEEVPSGVRTITGVSTSITAFVGRALKGPVNEPKMIHNFGDYERLYRGLWDQSTMSYAVRQYFQNGGQDALIVRIHNGATKATLTVPGPVTSLALTAESEGEWGNSLRVRVDHNTRDPLPGEAANSLFNLTVKDMKTASVERFLNVSTDPNHARFVTKVLEQESTLVRVVPPGTVPTARPTDHPAPPAGANPFETSGSHTASNNDGSDGIALTNAQFSGAGMENAKTGIYALEKADLFNLLCLPPLTFANDVSASTTLSDAQAYCKKRRAMLLVDAPSGWVTKDLAVAGITTLGLTDKNAAVFFPRLRAPDPLKEGRIETFVPCGSVAGVFARIDAQRGVWKAPAGQEATLVGVPELSVPLTDAENGELNPLGVNCLRSFPVVGRVVWGARTLEGADRLASEWKYIPVRRTALFIEESLYRGTQWVVFEPNDEPLWAQIRLNIGAFMQNLFRQGAFQGKTPREAYFVKCDKETTTQTDINLGIVNIVVGFAPLKPAEFVIIKIQQMAGQIEV